MSSEPESIEIYEGLGEQVMAVENKIVVTTGADTVATHKMQFFSQEMSDEAVAGCIFASCDLEQTGLVKVSVLMDFLLKSCAGESDESRELFNNLLDMFDPQQKDPQVTVEFFQAGLRSWITQMVADTDDTETILNTLRFSKLESEPSDSGNSLSTSQSISPSSEMLDGLQDNELQYQHNKLQELHKTLQTQLADVDEANVRLHTEFHSLQEKICNIEDELKEKNEELKQLLNDNSFLHNELQEKQDDLLQLMTRYQICEKELTQQNRQIESLKGLCSTEKEQIHQLEDTILHLEALIRTKEAELEDKDRQVHLLTLQLNEHQSTLDQSLASAERRISLVPPNFNNPSLAAELQCSSPFNAMSWKKPKDPIEHQGYILPWNAMFNEPEFEDELSNETVSFSRAHSPIRPDSELQILQTTGHINTTDSSVAAPSPAPEYDSRDLVLKHHLISTPREGRNAEFEPDMTGVSPLPPSPRVKRMNDNTAFKRVTKNVSMIILYLSLIFFVLSSCLAWSLLMLSIVDAGDCRSRGNPWAKLIDLLKPYCHIEQFGPPPV